MNINISGDSYKDAVSGLAPNHNLLTPVHAVSGFAHYPVKGQINIFRPVITQANITGTAPCSDDYVVAMMGNRQRDIVTCTGTSAGLPVEQFIHWSLRDRSPEESAIFASQVAAWVAFRRQRHLQVSRDIVRAGATLILLEGAGPCSRVDIGRMSEGFFENIVETNSLPALQQSRLPVAAGPVPDSVTSDPTPWCDRSVDSLLTGPAANLELRVWVEGKTTVSTAYLEDHMNWRRLPAQAGDQALMSGGVTLRVLFPDADGMEAGAAQEIEDKLEAWTGDRQGKGIAVSQQSRRAMCSIFVFDALSKSKCRQVTVTTLRHIFVNYVHEEYTLV